MIALLAYLVMLPPVQAAQEYAVKLSLERASAFAGRDLTVPLALELRDGDPIAAVDFEVVIPPGISFVGAEPSYSFRELMGTVRAAVRDDERNVVAVAFAAEPASMPEGVVGYLVFRLPAEAPLGPIELRARNGRARTAKREAARVELSVGAMSVVDPKSVVLPACFFYMH